MKKEVFEITVTIGIPVYNEEKSLGKNLSNIINIIRQNNLSEYVDVFVSNNSSTDGTESICDNYFKCNPDIFHYCTNKNNIGFDKNVDQLIYMSKGEYIWLVSGNDTITEQGLLDVLKMINNHHPNLIVLDRGGMNNESKFYNNWVNLLNDMTGLNILISTNIIKKNLWISYDLKKYIGSGWIFMGYTISCFNNILQNVTGGGG